MAARLDDWTTQPIMLLDVALLDPNPLNPRGEVKPEECTDITDSIKGTGAILQPLLVVPKGSRYTVVLGHRRRVGAIAAGLDKVPCIVKSLSIETQQEYMLIENLQRKALTPLQEAVGYCRRLGYDPDQVHRGRQWKGIVELGRRIGQTQQAINMRLTILKLPLDLRQLFEPGDRQLGVHMAPVLAEVADETKQRTYAILAARKRLTVHQLKKRIRNDKGEAGDAEAPAPEYAAAAPDPLQATDDDAAAHPQQPAPAARSREDVFAALAEVAPDQTTLADVQRAATLECELCGIYRGTPPVCQGCPLVGMITTLVKLDLRKAEGARHAQA